MPNPPYIDARLVNGDKPVTERWYIVFWAWDAQQEKLVRKRDYKINQLKTKSERHEYAKKHIRIINGFLADGAHVNVRIKKRPDISIYTQQDRNYTILEAFKYIMPLVKAARRPDTYNAYNSVNRMFIDFCEQAGWDNWKIRTLKQSDIIAWLDYMQVSKGEGNGISNLTRNNYLGYLSGMLTMMVDRKILDTNPALGVKQLKVDNDAGNIAYTTDEVIKLKEAIIAANPRLWLYVTFLLYGFMRPKEIGRLRVSMIDLADNNIYLPGSSSKNHFSRTVRISPHFRNYLLQLNLNLYRPDDYVFGKNLITGPNAIQKNLASAAHLEIVRELGFGEGYTLYSWKHTGVVIHYKAGVDIKTLQAQIGHRSLHETDVYLKSLHLYENTEIQDKSPAI